MPLSLTHALAQSSDAGLFAGFGAMMLVVWIIGAVLTIFWLWMLIDCLTSAMPTNEKLLWAVVMLLIPGIGSLLYFFIKRGTRPAAA